MTSELFSVDPVSGQLRTAISLDSDVNDVGVSEYILTVAASDGVKQIDNQLKIVVMDVNDNAPVFNQSVYFTHAVDNATSGLPVLYFTVSDNDKSSNIFVYLPDEVKSLFRVEIFSGGWYLVQEAEDANGMPDAFTIMARDDGVEEMVGKAYVVINRTCVGPKADTPPPPTTTVPTTTSPMDSGVCIIPKGADLRVYYNMNFY